MAKWPNEREKSAMKTLGWDRIIPSLDSLCFFHRRLIQDLLLSPVGATPGNTQNGVTCLLCGLPTLTVPGVKNFRHFIFFWYPHIFLPVQFTWHFRHPKTQLHILFTKSTLTGCQRSECNTRGGIIRWGPIYMSKRSVWDHVLNDFEQYLL